MFAPSLPTTVARPLLGAATALVLLATAACSATSTDPPVEPSSPAAAVAIPAQDGPGVTTESVTMSYSGWLLDEGMTAAQLKQSRDAVDAVVDTFNQQGGLAGRDVALVPPETDPGAAVVRERQDAYNKSNGLPLPDPTDGKAACDAYAGFAVFGFLGSDLASTPLGTPAAGACLNAAGHPVIGTNGWSTTDFDAAPATAGLTLAVDRRIDALIAAGKDSGMIGTAARFAVITDATQPDTANSAELSALADAGVTDPQVIPVNPTLGKAEALNVVVKLKSTRAERIIFLTSPDVTYTLIPTLLVAMQQQEFYPELLVLDGLSFEVLPYAQVDMKSPLISKIAAYTTTLIDSATPPPDEVARRAATPGGRLCAAAAAAHPALKRAIQLPLLGLCDELSLLKEALDASGSKFINAQAFTVGLGKLTEYDSPQLLATSFSPSRHDGASGLKRLTYDPRCTCGVPADDVVTFT